MCGISSRASRHVTPQLSAEPVAHRFKHFAWLHDRLIELYPCVMVPPIPDKQIQGKPAVFEAGVCSCAAGRFDDVFVEQRRRALERFLDRAARHPVIGPSPAFNHFLVTSDYQVG